MEAILSASYQARTRLIITAFLTIFITPLVHAQVAQELGRRVLPSGDTLVKRSAPSVWRFGVVGGVQGGVDAGSLAVTFPPSLAAQTLALAPAQLSFGWYAGAIAEWLPVGSRVGAALRLYAADVRRGLFSAALADNPFGYRRYEAVTALQYVTIAPSVFYAVTSDRRLRVFGGADVELLTSAANTVQPRLVVSEKGDVAAEPAIAAVPVNALRVDGHLGLSYDIPLLHTSPKAQQSSALQATVTPSLSVHAGMPIATGGVWTTPWNAVTVRFGMALTFGAKTMEEVRIPSRQSIAAGRSGGNELSNESSNDAVLGLAKTNKPSETDVVGGGGESQNILIIPNESTSLLYVAQQDTTLTAEMKRYLNSVVAYMKIRKKATVRLTGHVEAVGSVADKRKISEARAAEAARYLVAKGVERKRIVESGAGDKQPVGDNRTEAGRKQNRRLEIVVVE
jgi:outer membrane protein OmpA-like peptidoglycan-associated protein